MKQARCQHCDRLVQWSPIAEAWGRVGGEPKVRFRCLARSKHPDSTLGHAVQGILSVFTPGSDVITEEAA